MAIGSVNAFMSAAQGIASWDDDSESVRQAKMAQSNLEVSRLGQEVAGAIQGVGASLLFSKAVNDLSIRQSTLFRNEKLLEDQKRLNDERRARVRATSTKGPTGEGSTREGDNNELMLLSQANAEQIKIREGQEKASAAQNAVIKQFQSDFDRAKSSEDQGLTAAAGFTGYQENKFSKALRITGDIGTGLSGLGAFGKDAETGENRSWGEAIFGDDRKREAGTGWGIFGYNRRQSA